MIATADTGFVAKLYLLEPESAQARTIISSITPPILLTAWHTLEVANAFQRAVFSKTITPEHAQGCWQDFEADQTAGLFKIVALDHSRLLESAQQLTQKHTATIGTRTLDLIHVAAALEFGATVFLSFDARQKKAAQAEGLNVLPAVLP